MMDIPRSQKEKDSRKLPLILLALIPCFFLPLFSAIAIFNLLSGLAIYPSLIWLAFMLFIIVEMIKEDGGVKLCLIKKLGLLSAEHFVDINNKNTDRPELCFGYKFNGRCLYYMKIPTDKIAMVKWGTGQASSLAGQDMDDWSVGLWYHRDYSAKEFQQKLIPTSNLEVYLFGPVAGKNEITEFAHSIVDFLVKSGVPMIKEEEFTFIRNTVR